MPRKKTKSSTRPRKKTSFLEKSQVGISITSQAFQNLNEIVAETGLSKSKVVEGLVLGDLAIASNTAEKTISIESDPSGDTEANASKISLVEGMVALESNGVATTELSPVEDRDRKELQNLEELKQKLQEHKTKYQALKASLKKKDSLLSLILCILLLFCPFKKLLMGKCCGLHKVCFVLDP